jgi:Holliday junction resolvase
MSGRRSRSKGVRAERAIVRLLRGQGIAASKISRAWCAGADLCVHILGVDRSVEVKCRAAGFRQLYDWLDGRDLLIVKADHKEPLVILRMSLAAVMAKAATAISNEPGECNIRGRAE